MQLRSSRTLMVGVSCALAAACSAFDLIGFNAHDEPGLLIFYHDTSQIVAPDTVARGVAFEIAFTTFAGGCTRTIARTDVLTSGSISDIRPYDHTVGGDACTSDLLFLRHTAQVRFEAPGTAVLHILGQQRGASTGSADGPAELTRNVTVR